MNLRTLLPASALALAFAICSAPKPAVAACAAIPYVFVNGPGGSIVDATTTNANNNHFQSCATNVDYTQIGTSGILASQIIPQGLSSGIFGGAFGYEFYPNSAGQVPLTISGTAGQSVDLFDIALTHGGTKAFWVASTGTYEGTPACGPQTFTATGT